MKETSRKGSAHSGLFLYDVVQSSVLPRAFARRFNPYPKVAPACRRESGAVDVRDGC
jgi:hypothetical protein